MKTMIGKRGLFAALTAALLVTTMLITSCAAPSGGISDDKQAPPPEGMGSITLRIYDADGNSSGRSIAPATNPFVIGDITKYDLSIQKYTANDYLTVSGTADTSHSGIVPGDIDDPIYLYPGFYKVKVIAYIEGADPATPSTDDDVPVGIVETTGFEILAGVNRAAESLTLHPFDPADGEGYGKFAYTIVDSAVTSTPKSYSMTISPIVGGTAYNSGDPFDTTSALGISPITLRSGYYYVDLVLTAGTKVTSVRQVLHVYQNLTSGPYTYTFTEDNFISIMGSFSVDITGVDAIVDAVPSLEVDKNSSGTAVTLPLDGLVTLVKTPLDTAVVTVTNASSFTGGIAWYTVDPTTGIVNTTTPIGTGASLNITPISAPAGNNPFIGVGTFKVSVVGRVGATAGVPYETRFEVKIQNLP